MLSRSPNSAAMLRVQSWSRGTRPPEAIERLLELDWPVQVGQVAQGALDVICIGPADWLLVSKAGGDLVRAVEETLKGSSFRATNLSCAWARILIDGTAATALLRKACALDVGSPSLAPGRAARTLVAGVAVILRCLQPAVFECIAPSSYADYLLSWLADASAEFREHLPHT
jgi:heterotetrameric sarcosine oxidase gamma subunit